MLEEESKKKAENKIQLNENKQDKRKHIFYDNNF